MLAIAKPEPRTSAIEHVDVNTETFDITNAPKIIIAAFISEGYFAFNRGKNQSKFFAVFGLGKLHCCS
ncbi:MAG TPA: hypothetical protein DHV49_01230 [Alphaproteobacteria bacterium]|nr:hypothetical protein [Alphaproteobacteria bacterium]